MGDWRQLGGGFLLGVLSIILVLGGFALAMAEGGLIPAFAPQPSPTSIPQAAYPTLELLPPLDSTTDTPDIPLTPTETQTNTPPPPSTACPPPAGWVAITVQPFDSLVSIAQAYQVNPLQLQRANCLISNEMVAGSILYVPPQPTVTRITCGAPAGWLIYVVQPGDTLFRIGVLYRVSVSQLQQANCLGTSSAIYTGQQLRVPNVATSTATFTQLVPTGTATQTATLTLSPTGEITPEVTETATSVPTEITPSPTPVDTATTAPTQTPTP